MGPGGGHTPRATIPRAVTRFIGFMDIAIRPYRLEDADAVVKASHESTAEVFPWLPWCRPGLTKAELAEWLETQVEAFRERRQFEFAIVDDKAQFLGGCGINQINTHHKFGNVGYWIRTSATGRGIASAAVAQLIDFAERETDLVRLEIVVDAENPSSARVAEKVGGRLEGALRNRLVTHGKARAALMYSVVFSR